MKERILAFCREYLVDFNATQAMIRAGYSAKSAHTHVTRLLNRDDVQAELKRLLTQRMVKAEVDGQQVLELIFKMVRSDLTGALEMNEDGGFRLKPVDQWPESAKSAPVTVDVDSDGGTRVKFGPSPEVKARLMEILAKIAGIMSGETPTQRPPITIAFGGVREPIVEQ